MTHERDGGQAGAAGLAGDSTSGSHDLLSAGPGRQNAGASESLTTVLVAFGVNVLVAMAKSAAALVTGSASLVAEAAHSWADAGNEVFLLIANRRSRRPADLAHPFGHGREAYVWSMLAALGLFVAGAAVSVARGVQELIRPEAASDFIVGYAVLAVALVLEAISFRQSLRQAKPEAESLHRDLIEHILATSDPTLRAVVAEDSAALAGLLIAACGLAAHQLTGSPVPDAAGSILVGLLLAVVAIDLINRNRRFLVGQEAESHLAVRLRALEARISSSPAVAGALLSLSAPDEPTLEA